MMKGYDRDEALAFILARIHAKDHPELADQMETLIGQAIDADMKYMHENGVLDEEALLDAQRLSARAGYRMTCRELEMHQWNAVQQRDRLLGCSMTGWQDMVNATGLGREEQARLLDRMREAVHEAADRIADSLGQKRPLPYWE